MRNEDVRPGMLFVSAMNTRWFVLSNVSVDGRHVITVILIFESKHEVMPIDIGRGDSEFFFGEPCLGLRDRAR